MKAKFSYLPTLLVVLAACGKDASTSGAHPSGTHTHADGSVHKDEPAAAGHGHGDEVALGECTLGDLTIQVTQAGKVEAGHEASFGLAFSKGKPMPGTVRGWIGIESAQGSMKGKFEKEGEAGMHGHIDVPKPVPPGSKLWIEIETAAGVSKTSVAYKL